LWKAKNYNIAYFSKQFNLWSRFRLSNKWVKDGDAKVASAAVMLDVRPAGKIQIIIFCIFQNFSSKAKKVFYSEILIFTNSLIFFLGRGD